MKEESFSSINEMDTEGEDVDGRTMRMAEGVTTLEVSLIMLEKGMGVGDADLGSSLVGDEES